MGESQRGRPVAVAGGAVTLLAIIIGGVFGRGIAEEASKAIFGETASDVLESRWTTSVVAGVRVSSPNVFEAKEFALPADVHSVFEQSVERFETHESAAGPVQLSISRVVYKQNVVVSIDGAARGAIERAKQAVGAVDHSSSTTPIIVSG